MYHIKSMRHFANIILIGLLSFCLAEAQAQSRSEKVSTFGLSVLGGINLSQIDGDNFKGYDNIGLYAGLRGSMRFNTTMQLRIELLYSQKGSKFESARSALVGKKDRYIKLNYAEIPILFAYRFNRPEAKTALWLEGGISVATLIKSDVRDSDNPSDKEFIYGEIEDEFKRMDFSLIGGFGIDPLPNLGFGIRFTWGLAKFYQFEGEVPPTGNAEYVQFLKNYSISVFALYHF
jgi:Outer membrane protein beta-barrel domain